MWGAANHGRLGHDSMVHIVDKLWKAPLCSKAIHAILYSTDSPMPEPSEVPQLVWEKCGAKQIRNCPAGFLAQRLQERYGDEGLTQEASKLLASTRTA